MWKDIRGFRLFRFFTAAEDTNQKEKQYFLKLMREIERRTLNHKNVFYADEKDH